MGVTNSNKVISTDRIDCDGSLKVTLALTAAPDIVANPTDIVLVLDRSGSMTGTPLASMKDGAKTFIDIIAEATGGSQSGSIGSGSRIAIVSFADSATADTQLITSVDALKGAVDALTAGGNTPTTPPPSPRPHSFWTPLRPKAGSSYCSPMGKPPSARRRPLWPPPPGPRASPSTASAWWAATAWT